MTSGNFNENPINDNADNNFNTDKKRSLKLDTTKKTGKSINC